MTTDPKVLFLQLMNDVERIFNSDNGWSWKYNRIFGMADNFRSVLKDLNITLDYTDPNLDYEDDVRAYVEALWNIKANLEKE